MYFYCPRCGRVFSEDEFLSVRYTDEGYSGEKGCCPSCGNDYFKRVNKCVKCNGTVFSRESLCSRCLERLKSEFEEFLSRYSEEEREFILSYG